MKEENEFSRHIEPRKFIVHKSILEVALLQ